MLLVQETPEFAYVLRGIAPNGVWVNQQLVERSFLLTPRQLLADWRPRSVAELQPDDFAPALELQPEVILLGTGPRQHFPTPLVLASVMRNGVGLEVMDSAAAARTFNVLAGEGRKVLAGFLITPAQPA